MLNLISLLDRKKMFFLLLFGSQFLSETCSGLCSIAWVALLSVLCKKCWFVLIDQQQAELILSTFDILLPDSLFSGHLWGHWSACPPSCMYINTFFFFLQMNKCISFVVMKPELEAWPCCLLRSWPWASCFTFLMCKEKVKLFLNIATRFTVSMALSVQCLDKVKEGSTHC